MCLAIGCIEMKCFVYKWVIKCIEMIEFDKWWDCEMKRTKIDVVDWIDSRYQLIYDF